MLDRPICQTMGRRPRSTGRDRGVRAGGDFAERCRTGRHSQPQPQRQPQTRCRRRQTGAFDGCGAGLCRASFHRIDNTRRNACWSKSRTTSSNNLNLNQIADEEVVRLYTAVLDEINHIQIADREKESFARRASAGPPPAIVHQRLSIWEPNWPRPSMLPPSAPA